MLTAFMIYHTLISPRKNNLVTFGLLRYTPNITISSLKRKKSQNFSTKTFNTIWACIFYQIKVYCKKKFIVIL